MNNTQNQQLTKENELLSKIILEIVLRDEVKTKGLNMTDEQIDELFKREDWKEKTEFKLTEDKDGWWMSYKGVHSWLVRPRKPIAILKRMNEEKKNQEKALDAYHKLTSEQAVKVRELEETKKELTPYKEQIQELQKENFTLLSIWHKEVEESKGIWEQGEPCYWNKEDLEELIEQNKSEPNKTAIQIIEKWEIDAETHSEGIDKSEEWKNKKVEILEEEIADKSKNLERSSKLIEKKDLQISELQQEVQQLKINLEKANKTIEKKDLENRDLLHLSLSNKELPPLPKKQNKFKLLGKLKNKCQQFKQFMKKQKVQEQELVCQIEIKNNNL